MCGVTVHLLALSRHQDVDTVDTDVSVVAGSIWTWAGHP